MTAYTCLTVRRLKAQVPAPVDKDETTPAVKSFFFKVESTPQPKKDVAKPKISAETEELKGEYTLEPCLFSLKALKYVTERNLSVRSPLVA